MPSIGKDVAGARNRARMQGSTPAAQNIKLTALQRKVLQAVCDGALVRDFAPVNARAFAQLVKLQLVGAIERDTGQASLTTLGEYVLHGL